MRCPRFIASAGLAALTAIGLALPAGADVHAAKPYKPSQLGIDTYFTFACQTPSVIRQDAETEIGQFKKLGANAIGLGFPLYTDSITSNDVFAKTQCGSNVYESPPPLDVALVIEIAHANGLKVLLRPLIDQENLFAEGPNDWRGNLAPTNLKTWFSNYFATLKPYLTIAQGFHADSFALETELDSLADYSNWTATIKSAQKLYHGTLVWDYSWYTGVKKSTRPGTSFAVDTYPKLSNTTASSTPAQLLSDWNSLLALHSYGIPHIAQASIDEVGIAAQVGAYANSNESAFPLSTHPFDQQIQVNWFTTACQFAKTHKMRAIYFWGPWLTANGGAMLSAPDPSKPSNIQPATQAAIRSCFK